MRTATALLPPTLSTEEQFKSRSKSHSRAAIELRTTQPNSVLLPNLPLAVLARPNFYSNDNQQTGRSQSTIFFLAFAQPALPPEGENTKKPGIRGCRAQSFKSTKLVISTYA